MNAKKNKSLLKKLFKFLNVYFTVYYIDNKHID